MQRNLILPTLLLVAMSSFVSAQEPAADDKAWAREARPIVEQNDSHWVDDRWQNSEIGPCLGAAFATPKGRVLKGLAIRVGDDGQAGVCYDTARLTMRVAWTGEFLRFGGRRFGLIEPPAVAGDLAFATPEQAGWAFDGRFEPTQEEITDVPMASRNMNAAATVRCLPDDWATYRGRYVSGDRVVLSYDVGSVGVLESPWYVSADGIGAFTRSFEIEPCDKPMQVWLADGESRIEVVGEQTVVSLDETRPVATIAPRNETVRVKFVIAKKETSDNAMSKLVAAAGVADDLTTLIANDPGRYPEVVETVGQTTEADDAYVIDTVTLPFDNPWNSLLFTAGHDFFSDGRAAVCMAHGDVWTVDGVDRDLKQLKWRRFATGLFQPLGLRIVDDHAYVICRDQIVKLNDRNDDGEADFYESFNNQIVITPGGHDYVTCLDTDSQGNFYFIHAHTGVMKVAADGSSIESVAYGFRNPNGMGVSPDGMITASPQQGTWTPESCLIVVKPGGYYGFGGPRVTEDRPTGWDLPMCFIPRAMDNSGGGQTWVEGDRWGPLTGQMLHLSFGQCRILLALTEKVGDIYQGGTIALPSTPADFESGIMRGRFNPHDGQLYVSGLRGWQTRAIRDGCFQRLRYTGAPVNLPVDVKTFENGLQLTFAETLDPQFADDPDNFSAEQWNYLYSDKYGSPDFSVSDPNRQGRDPVQVVSATLQNDGRSVFLEMPGRVPVNQLVVNWLLRSKQGQGFQGSYAHTINVPPAEAFPEDSIRRTTREPLVPDEVVSRLKPGIAMRFESLEGKSDVRVSRLVSLIQPIDELATLFLEPGPFNVTASGTIYVKRSGFYEFRVKSRGKAGMSVNDDAIPIAKGVQEPSHQVLLRKGHNGLRLVYQSPAEGVAQFVLEWRSDEFGWEPVLPSVLFHDSGDDELVSKMRARDGREMFARYNCFRCHQTELDGEPMFEMTLEPPSLELAGSRFNENWLREWILDPSALQSHATMPKVLGEGDESKQKAADIAAYLASLKGDDIDSAPTTSNGADGETLYEVLGCIACHVVDGTGASDEFDRRSLVDVGRKYRRPDALRSFLLSPTKHFASTRMPTFDLTAGEAAALADFLVQKSSPATVSAFPSGDVQRGKELFSSTGCGNCHRLDEDQSLPIGNLPLAGTSERTMCLSADREPGGKAPVFNLTKEQQLLMLLGYILRDDKSVNRSIPVETSARLVKSLNCAACHDRDGQRAIRMAAIAEEGSGLVPEVIPSLTWAGEKFRPDWTEKLLKGEVKAKPRPWLKASMPAFPAYAKALAEGLACEHAVDVEEAEEPAADTAMAEVGDELTLATALDCRQCHAIGDQHPRGDDKTKIALGINFDMIGDRMRRDAFHRFMLDPPRYDINTRMIKLSADGVKTKLDSVYDGDAQKQFEALWQFIQSRGK